MQRTTESLLREVEEDLLIAADLFDRGYEIQPILDRLEAEYNRHRQHSATDRIKAMLAEHHAEAGGE
jgi:hypothetical protein